jgi:glycosyltransferase involved in cell wall biosynthesis
MPSIYSFQFGKPSNTIIHIHNWFNTLNVEDLEIIFSKGFKIVFTFHDERLLTGGCHSSLECRYFGNCNLCPGKGRIIQRKIANNLEKQLMCFKKNQGNYAIITPSGWLWHRTRKFSEIRGVDVVKIPNYFPPALCLSRPQNSTAIQTRIIRLGIASLDPFNFIKGGDLVKQISKIEIQEKLQIELVFLKSFVEHSDFWSSINALLVPSVSENSPNVIFEAAQFEIPVIATKVGGIPELLNAEVDLIFDSTISGLQIALREMKTRLNDSDFGDSLTIRKHLDLYQTLLNR